MTSYVRPAEDQLMHNPSKRGLNQEGNDLKSDRTLRDVMRAQKIKQHKPLFKQLYFDLLKRTGAESNANNGSTNNKVQLAKELFFDLLKRDSSNSAQPPRNKNADLDNHLLMAKELFFNLLKRNGNSKQSNHDLISLLQNRNPENVAKLQEYFFKLLSQSNSLTSTNSQGERMKNFVNKNSNVELVKDLYFDLLKRNADPKLTGSKILQLLRAKNSNLNKNLGMVKDLYFKLLKRDAASKKESQSKNEVQENAKGNANLKMVKDLHFDLLKRSSDRTNTNSDLLRLIKMKLIKGKTTNLDEKLGMVKDLYFKLLKRDTGSATSKSEQTLQNPDGSKNEKLAKELYFSFFKRNNGNRNLITSNSTKNEDFDEKFGLVKELYFNLLKRDNSKKDLIADDQIQIPYSAHPHLHSNNDIVKHLFFNIFE